MPRVSLVQKASHQLSSNNIVEAALTYLKATEGLLGRQHRRKEICEDEYTSRKIEIQYLTSTIEKFKSEVIDLQDEIKNLQDEINKLKEENSDLKKENQDLHAKMNNLSQNFRLIHLDENKEVKLGRKKHEMINALHNIQKILDWYKNKYKSEFEKTWSLNNVELSSEEAIIKEEIIKAIYSVDFYQLQGFYLSFDLRYSSFLSHVLFYFRKDTERFMKEFNQISIDSVNNWLKEKVDIVNEYQKSVLMFRNPLINNDNMEMMLNRAIFSIPQEYTLSDNLDSIFSNFA
ncbi:19904_t:CDS:2 [Racocetra fulgida]|uniref:19904_t:CDS:1 n=1 Tax=Racocetra fulgida TaxID=60492 RepID=A0A9N9BL29_9GLOM|nr:19904_t:CDS:2 [Racocetra fulgida]